MRVYVTQGHENGIGLEVFFKSCHFLGDRLDSFQLIGFRESIKKTLISLRQPFEVFDNHIDLAGRKIPTIFLKKDIKISQSFQALQQGMSLAEKNGVLFTLPTTKDQFPGKAGHTEFFRSHYHAPELGMCFLSQSLKLLLLTDHVPLKDVGTVLNEKVIEDRIATLVKVFKKWRIPANNIYVSGINPHAGENGLLGDNDYKIKKAVVKLKNKMKINISGPHSGDTMIFKQKSPDDIFIYAHHDQGLGVFKSLEGFIGANVTLGLPYLRLSPDHGTSFELYGKNQADYRGCEYALKLALNFIKKV